MKILITGIAGFIGSHLAKRLADGNEVFGLVREPLNTTYLDGFSDNIKLLYTDGSAESVRDAVISRKPDLTFHLAAYYTGAHDFSNIGKLISSNIIFGTNLLEALSECGKSKFVYASTVMQYADGEEYAPQNLYAATKKAFSDIVEYYADSGKISAACVILNDTYGAADRRPKILNLLKKAALNGESLDLTSGSQTYNLLYIDDVIDGFILAARQLENTKYAHGFFQLQSRDAISLKETVEKMIELNGLKLRANWGAKPDPERQIYIPAKVFAPPEGWSQKIPLERGLKMFFEEDN